MGNEQEGNEQEEEEEDIDAWLEQRKKVECKQKVVAYQAKFEKGDWTLTKCMDALFPTQQKNKLWGRVCEPDRLVETGCKGQGCLGLAH